MNNNFQDMFPYMQQMTDQFRKVFGDDFVKNLMGSMQNPNWWQFQNNGGGAGAGAGAEGSTPNSNSRFGQGGSGSMYGFPDASAPTGSGWNPFAAAGPSPGAAPSASRTFPVGDLYETRHEVVLVIELPGIERASDIRLAVHSNALVVKGEIQRKYPRSGDSLATSERFTGPFERRFTLPVRVRRQHAKATYASGLLEVRLIKESKSGDDEGTVVDVDFLA